MADLNDLIDRTHFDYEQNETKAKQLDECIGVISNAAPDLARRLVEIAMSERTRPYTSVDAIKTCLAFLQTGVIDRENKAKMRELFRSIEKLEGQPQAIDI